MRKPLPRVLLALFAIVLSMVVCFVAIAAAFSSVAHAGSAFSAMFWGAFGDWPAYFDGGTINVITRPLGEAVNKMALLTLTGLSVAVAFRVGLFNIGAQGQMMVGALVAAQCGAALSTPTLVHLPLAILAAAFGGALYALLPALLKEWRGVHEVISTIMMNWIAISLIENWLVTGPLRAGAAGDNSVSGTAQIAQTAQLPLLLGDLSRMNAGIFLALGLALLLWLVLTRWTRGYEWRAVGMSSSAAEAAGIAVARRRVEAMLISGALAGLAGAVLILGTEHKYPATLAAPYGFDGIAIALIGNSHPLGVALTAGFFGALRAGGTRMQLVGVHKSFPELIQGIALLLVAASYVWDRLLSRVRTKQVPT